MIEFAAWQDAELPFTVEYARPAFERIRQSAAEGLIALPRVGMGVGGLLLGERTPGGIRVAGTVELPCSHTLGPTFQLTPDEIRQSLELVSIAATQRAVVGIYCTRTRGSLTLGATDRELFDVLCPEPWQIVLVLRPAPGELTRAAVFFRQAGKVEQGTVKELWEWRPVELAEPHSDSPAEPDSTATAAAHPQPPEPLPAPPPPVVMPMQAPGLSAVSTAVGTATPTVIEMPLPRTAPAASGSAVRIAPPVIEAPAASAAPAPPPPKRTPANPQFAVDPPRAPRAVPAMFGAPFFGQRPVQPPGQVQSPSKVPLRLTALAAGLIILAVGSGMFATRDAWLPRPPLALSCTDTNGMLEIRWNAAAARGLDHGSLLINDGGGGQLDSVALDPLTLLSGSFLYKRKSDRVTVTLDLGNERARTAFPPEPEGAGATAVPAQDAAANSGTPPATTLPNPPSSGAISAFGNPPQPAGPAEAAPAAAPISAATGRAPLATPRGGTAPAQAPSSTSPVTALPRQPAAAPGR